MGKVILTRRDRLQKLDLSFPYEDVLDALKDERKDWAGIIMLLIIRYKINNFFFAALGLNTQTI